MHAKQAPGSTRRLSCSSVITSTLASPRTSTSTSARSSWSCTRAVLWSNTGRRSGYRAGRGGRCGARGGDTLDRQCVLHHLGERRRGDLPAVDGTLGLVEDDDGGESRRVRGREPGERRDVVVGRFEVWRLAGGAGLAGDAVPRDLGLGSGPAGDDAFEHLTHLGCRVR